MSQPKDQSPNTPATRMDRRAERRYEPPQVEKVLTRDELEREVLYAGGGPSEFINTA